MLQYEILYRQEIRGVLLHVTFDTDDRHNVHITLTHLTVPQPRPLLD